MVEKSNSLREGDIKHVIHPYTNARKHEEQGPMIITRGEGIYVYDDAGKEYIDAPAGLWSVAVGFSEKRLRDALIRQMDELPFYHTFHHKANVPSIKLAEKLAEITPDRLTRVFFANSGSEANDSVVKFVWYYNNARGKSQKKKFLARTGAYHGITVASGSLSGLAGNHRDFDLPIIPVRHLTCPHFYRYALENESEADFVERLAKELEDVITEEGPDTIAAFIGEPLMGAAGVIPPPAGYWQRVQEICRRNDILVVADEVITGFGRLGTMFGSEYYGIDPDIMVLSKQLTSSYQPLSAVMLSDAVYEVIADNSSRCGTLAHGFTAGGHPLATAVGLENLKIIEERNLVENARRMGEVLHRELDTFRGHELVGEIRGVGLIAAVEFVTDRKTKAYFDPVGLMAGKLFEATHRHGLIIRTSGDAVAFSPPLIINEEQVVEMVRRFGRALDEVTSGS